MSAKSGVVLHLACHGRRLTPCPPSVTPLVRSPRVRGENGQNFSNSRGYGAGFNFAGRERTKNFNPRRTL